MEFSLTIIVVIAVALILLKVAKNLFSKLIGLIVVVGIILGVMYYQGIGPFKNEVASLNFLESKYCIEGGDSDICDCIIKKAKKDIESRFSVEERDSLRSQKLRAAYVLQKSLNATKEEAMSCLTLRGETNKYKVFLQDFVPVDNKYLDMIGEKARDLGNRLKEEINQLQENKEDIDSKY